MLRAEGRPRRRLPVPWLGIDAASPVEGDPPSDAHRQVDDVIDRYYTAFEAADLDDMSDLWLHDDDVTCTHPGWATLHGWGAISASWFAIFDQAERLQVFVTDRRVRVDGDAAWVTLDENLLGAGEPGGTTVAAVKVLRRTDVGWRIVLHHGSVVVANPDPDS